MKLVLEIKDSRVTYFMDLIKNLDFIKLIKTVKGKDNSNISKTLISGKKGKKIDSGKISNQFIPLDYSKYNFNTKDLKFDRNEINER